MAAIIEPRRYPTNVPQRPALRLVTSDGRTQVLPVELGLRTAHVVAAVVALVVVLLASLAIGGGALASLAPAPAGAGAATAPRATAAVAGQTVTARSGDSLWTIARRIQPTGDVRTLVDEMVAVNGAQALQPGDEIVIPS